MKNLKLICLFAFACLFLMSCVAPVGGEPTISLGTAIRYCFTTTSYVVWFAFTTIVSLIIIYALIKSYREEMEWSKGHNIFLAISIALFLAGLLIRPCEIAANTTVEQFSRGVIIGY